MKEIRVTQVIGCTRQLWYEAQKHKKDLTHPIAIIGTELHNAIDEYITEHKEPVFKYFDNNYRFDNFLLIKDSLDLTDFIVEKRYYSKKFNPILTGKPDLITNNTILYDWKSGKAFRQSHELQLNAYSLLLKENNINITHMCITYLGNNYPLQIWLKPTAQKTKLFMKYFNDSVDVLTSKKIPTAPQIEHADFGCLFCEYFTKCKEDYYNGF